MVSLSTTKDCCSTIEEESDESSEHQRHHQISELDGQKLHYLNGSASSTSLNLCKDVVGSNPALLAGGAGDNFNQKFDQLAKLHDLYASVSSISAKSQSHLEERSRNNHMNNNNGSRVGLNGNHNNGSNNNNNQSTFSLGSLVFGEPDCNSSNCSVSDINSLCSEPVLRLLDYNNYNSHSAGAAARDNLGTSDISRLNHAGLRTAAAAAEREATNGLSISLSDLGFENGCDPLNTRFEHNKTAGGGLGLLKQPPLAAAAAYTSIAATSNGSFNEHGTAVTTASSLPIADPATAPSAADRSDSPILEGIDQELAKYAKLKDLKQAYNGGGAAPAGGNGTNAAVAEVDAISAYSETSSKNEAKLLPPPPPPASSIFTSSSSSCVEAKQRLQLPALSSSSVILTAPPSSSSSSSTCLPHRRQLPDGASNPDLNNKLCSGAASSSSPLDQLALPPSLSSAVASTSFGSLEVGVKQQTSSSLVLTAPLESSFDNVANCRTKASSALSNATSSTPLPTTRRSPGTGQSSCGSDLEELEKKKTKSYHHHHHHHHQKSSKDSLSSQQKSSSSTSSSDVENGERKVWETQQQQQQQQQRRRSKQTDSSTSSSGAVVIERGETAPTPPAPQAAKAKVPRFSRLFSSAKKISRSPLKIVKEDKNHQAAANKGGSTHRSSSGKGSETVQSKKGRSGSIGSPAFLRKKQHQSLDNSCSSNVSRLEHQQQQQQGCSNSSSPPCPPSNASRFFDKNSKKGLLISSSSSRHHSSSSFSSSSSKNAKGTSSSKCLETTTAASSGKSNSSSSKISNNGKTGKSTSVTNCAAAASTSSSSVALIPSPYSFLSAPTKPKGKKGADTSSNDSGISQQSLVRLRDERGRGATSLTSSQRRAKHCKSSGYESFGLEESERDSIESPTSGTAQKTLIESEEEEKRIGANDEKKEGKKKLEEEEVRSETEKRVCLTLCNLNLPQIPIMKYGADYVRRLDSRSRTNQFKALKSEQERLKTELFSAKSRIGSDPKRWSYELHVEDSLTDRADPTFVEAFTKETQILRKRVNACKSHVKMMTCFDIVQPSLLPVATAEEEKGGGGEESGKEQLDGKCVSPPPPASAPAPLDDASNSNKANLLSPKTRKRLENCCTTDCEFAQDIVLQMAENPENCESEII